MSESYKWIASNAEWFNAQGVSNTIWSLAKLTSDKFGPTVEEKGLQFNLQAESWRMTFERSPPNAMRLRAPPPRPPPAPAARGPSWR